MRLHYVSEPAACQWPRHLDPSPKRHKWRSNAGQQALLNRQLERTSEEILAAAAARDSAQPPSGAASEKQSRQTTALFTTPNITAHAASAFPSTPKLPS